MSKFSESIKKGRKHADEKYPRRLKIPDHTNHSHMSHTQKQVPTEDHQRTITKKTKTEVRLIICFLFTFIQTVS